MGVSHMACEVGFTLCGKLVCLGMHRGYQALSNGYIYQHNESTLHIMLHSSHKIVLL